jgi:hypothetical protein
MILNADNTAIPNKINNAIILINLENVHKNEDETISSSTLQLKQKTKKKDL